MITLYETILSSTKSGKNSKINRKYLLDFGFTEGKNGMYQLKLEDHYFYIIRYKDIYYIRLERNIKGIIETTKHLVQSYNDFDLVLDYWKAVANKDSNLEILTKKQLVKEKLKRF